MKPKLILFDMDGTLTDSGLGIMNSAQHALKKYGKEVDDLSELTCFIGPPLPKQFEIFCGFSEEESMRAVSYFREYYVEKGIYENSVYDGIRELLQMLKDAGFKLAVATSKPENLALVVTEYFDLTKYFDFIGGSLMSGKRTVKAEVISHVLSQFKDIDKEEVIMVGDTHYDVIGAKELGLHSIGVLYGYGREEDIKNAGPDYIASTPADVGNYILSK